MRSLSWLWITLLCFGKCGQMFLPMILVFVMSTCVSPQALNSKRLEDFLVFLFGGSVVLSEGPWWVLILAHLLSEVQWKKCHPNVREYLVISYHNFRHKPRYKRQEKAPLILSRASITEYYLKTYWSNFKIPYWFSSILFISLDLCSS